MRGQRFGSADAPYFRTAVHEIGHAMGLYHNTADTGFMNTTGTIANAAAPGTFPANIKWGYADDDLKRLRHMPDPWVRPGMIPFGQAYGSVPLSPNDQLLDAPGWELSVNPLIDCVPLGAPVRVELKLTNVGEIATPVPESLGFKAGHVRGRVIDAAGNVRSFSPLVRCIEEHEVSTLEPEHSLRHSLTLLRGAQGALFGSPGLHTIEVEVALEAGNMKIGAVGQAQVMIEAPLTDSHSRAAMKLLSTPDVLLTLAIGGDHMTEGLEAIQDALKDKTLQPHFAWIEAKRLGRASGKRKADLQSACKQLSKDTICSLSEARRLEKLLKGATPEEKLSAPVKAVTDFLGSLLVRFEKELEVSPMGSDHKGKSKPAKKETAKS